MIFSAPDLMKRLNSITHPIIVREIEREVESSHYKNVFIEIPLFYQMDVKFPADLVLFVEADKEIQAERLAKRDEIGKFYAESKIRNQESLIRNRSDKEIVIKNNSSLEDLKEKIEKILRKENIYESN